MQTPAQAQQQARRGPKLKQLHWVKLNTPQQGTIWQRVDVSQARLNFAQLEADFQILDREVAQAGFTPARKAQISLLEHSRGHVLAIELASIRVPFTQVRAALLQADGGKLASEMLSPLLRAVPEQKEIADIQLYLRGEHPEHKGKSDPNQLAIVERYFAQVMDIPQLQARVECFLFTHQFASNAKRVREQLMLLQAACQEVQGSQLLIQLLQAVLGVGNYLNQGTFKGNAPGFKLESLLKLVDCRGSNDCKSLLHFILDQLLQDAPQIEALPKELLTVQPAGKLQVAGISSLLVDLRSGLKQVRTTLLEPAERLQSSTTPVEQAAAASMLAFHRDSRAAFVELEALDKAVHAEMKRVSEYFGELHEAGDPARVLRVIRNFMPVFDKTLEEVKKLKAMREAQKRQEERRLSRTQSVPVTSSRTFLASAHSLHPSPGPLPGSVSRFSSGDDSAVTSGWPAGLRANSQSPSPASCAEPRALQRSDTAPLTS